MKWRKLATVAALLAAVLFSPALASAQVGLEEGTMLRAQRQHRPSMLVFSSDVDTIASTANDTTGTMYAAGYVKEDPTIIYTVASGGTVSLDMIQQFSATGSGPWISTAHDTISATGSSYILVAEGSDYHLPYFRIIVDGIGSNDAATIFTALYIVFLEDSDELKQR